ncbi:hypothetical protein ACM66B_003444 [Microbotryomycetes sp. NB124-2]
MAPPGAGTAPARGVIPPPPPGFPGANAGNTPSTGVPPPPPQPMMMMQQQFLPPVPPPWTEHRAPGGQPYWFNPQTNVSTYVRPVPPPPPGFPPTSAAGMYPPQPQPTASAPTKEKRERKEKPRDKVPVPGTSWIRVTTTKDNVFYTNKDTKTSVWTVPDEIKEQVALLENQEKEKARQDKIESAEQLEPAGKKRKVEHVIEEENKEDTPDNDVAPLEIEVEASNGQTKPLETADSTATEANADDEVVVEPKKKKNKKTKVVREIEELEQDEEWQRQVAADMAREQEEAEEAERQRKKEVEGVAKSTAPAAPAAAELDVSQEEAAAFFKAMLAEKDIDPMAPWDMELPKFINDPRYLAVKQLRNRRDLFDEFCKDKIREMRAAKKRAAEGGAPKIDPTTAYRDLLKQHVTSTRTHFSDFKRAHAKDPRFRDFGKTEGEKEKVFRQWLRELGEHKRAQAIVAEDKFKDMLIEDKAIRKGDKWTDVKGRHASDSRYQAVTSSSLRESLFNKYVATLDEDSGRGDAEASTSKTALSKEERAARAQASLREREAQVRADKERATRSAGLAKRVLGREEGEREFGQLLVDLVRDHEARWDDVVEALANDSRFTDSPLSNNDKRDLFERHARSLYDKRLKLVQDLFAAHSPLLVTPFHDVLPFVKDSPHVKALVHDNFDELEMLFDRWNRARYSKARDEFDELLKESPIIEHWGRLQKKKQEGDGNTGMAHEGDEDEEGEDDMPSLVEMAKQVDLPAIHKTLKHDKRYTQFDYDAESRDRWVKAYLDELGAPKQTVHQR